MVEVNWQVTRRPVDISAFGPDGKPPLGVVIVHGLDSALSYLTDLPVTYEVRGQTVSGLDEFRRRVDAAEEAKPGDFVIRPENGMVGTWIESM